MIPPAFQPQSLLEAKTTPIGGPTPENSAGVGARLPRDSHGSSDDEGARGFTNAATSPVGKIKLNSNGSHLPDQLDASPRPWLQQHATGRRSNRARVVNDSFCQRFEAAEAGQGGNHPAYQRRVVHVVGVKRAVYPLERGHAPRLSPDCPRPLGHRLTFKRSTLRCPFEYPLTLFPPRLDRRFNPDGCHRSRAGSARRRQGTTLTDADPPPAASRGARRPTRDDTRTQPRDPRIDPQEHSFLGSDPPIRGHRRILLPAKNIYLEDDGR